MRVHRCKSVHGRPMRLWGWEIGPTGATSSPKERFTGRPHGSSTRGIHFKTAQSYHSTG